MYNNEGFRATEKQTGEEYSPYYLENAKHVTTPRLLLLRIHVVIKLRPIFYLSIIPNQLFLTDLPVANSEKELKSFF